jgi:hypothetical protein
MSVTPATFRADWPEFADVVSYPDAAINFWLNYASKFQNTEVWGMPAALAAATGGVSFASQPVAGQSITLNGTAVTFVAAGAIGNQVNIQSSLAGTVTALVAMLAASLDAQLVKFKYLQVNNGVLFTATTAGSAGNALTLSTTVTTAALTGPTLQGGTDAASSPPATEYDIGLELLVAHYITLNKKQADAAAAGALPGLAEGVISSKSVGPASVSYDTQLTGEPGAGHWNLTTYGQRYYRLAEMMGSGPQMSYGAAMAGPYSGTAWSGPPGWPGWFYW